MARTIQPGYDLYFITFSIIGWIDVFTRPQYVEILYDSFRYAQQHKGLQIHAYVIMTNHVHLLLSSTDKPVSEIVRDFKKFTSHQLHAAIEGNPQESRKEWMMSHFAFKGRTNPRNEEFQLWQHGSHSLPLWGTDMIRQKIAYIHGNPVRQGWVELPEAYLNSSARAYAGRWSPIEVAMLDGC